MLNSAKRRLQDSRLESLSEDSQFALAYGAAHALALAAMRWHGYRSDNRYLVFQCLQHTVGLGNAKYEGHLGITPQLLKELITVTGEVLSFVEALGPVK